MQNIRIPPPIVALIAVIGVYITSLINAFTFTLPWWIPILVFVLGIVIAFLAMGQFGRAQTTTDPIHPESASSLVTTGIYGYTRNPMYLGLALFVLAFVLLFGSWLGFIWVVAFIVYIQLFQIRREEAAMRELFGDHYVAYCRRVRRWI